MSVVAATEKDLAEIRKRDPDLADGALAAAALQMAAEVDSFENKGHAKSLCAKELRDTMAVIRDLAPKKARNDRVDEIKAKREKRRAS